MLSKTGLSWFNIYLFQEQQLSLRHNFITPNSNIYSFHMHNNNYMFKLNLPDAFCTHFFLRERWSFSVIHSFPWEFPPSIPFCIIKLWFLTLYFLSLYEVTELLSVVFVAFNNLLLKLEQFLSMEEVYRVGPRFRIKLPLVLAPQSQFPCLISSCWGWGNWGLERKR